MSAPDWRDTIARALAEHGEDHYAAMADAVLDAIKAADFAIVAREPTVEMIEAGIASVKGGSGVSWEDDMRCIWRGMIEGEPREEPL